jgi:hypothetical protein
MAQEVPKAVMPQAVTRDGVTARCGSSSDKLGLKFQSYDQWLAAGGQVPAGAPVRH